MLKKNWLLSKGERRDFIYLTIGQPPKLYVTYGYSNEPSNIDMNSGAIDMIPYWEWEGTDGIFRKWYLTAFYASDSNKYCYMYLRCDNSPNYGVNAKENLKIKVYVSLVEEDHTYHEFYNYYYYRPYNDDGSPSYVICSAMKNALGSTIKVTFNPPPTGYL